jgi:sugar phosphate isomerase/epimerase
VAIEKLSIGSWAYAFGPYEKDPVPFDAVCARLGELGYDGIEVGGFRPHVHPDDYPSKADRDGLCKLIADAGLEVSGAAIDFWSEPGPGTDAAQENDAYFKLFQKNLQYAVDLGAPSIRVDTVSPPAPIEGTDDATAWKRITEVWRRCAQLASEAGIKMVWEFEPGFKFNKPSEIVRMVDDVAHPNFSVLFDTCHAYMCGVVGARQEGTKETLKGGLVEFTELLKGKIGHAHVIDSDGTLHGDETSTHRPFGEGNIDFDEIIPAIEAAGYHDKWWTIDLCFWPEAWEVTENAKKFLAKYMTS